MTKHETWSQKTDRLAKLAEQVKHNLNEMCRHTLDELRRTSKMTTPKPVADMFEPQKLLNIQDVPPLVVLYDDSATRIAYISDASNLASLTIERKRKDVLDVAHWGLWDRISLDKKSCPWNLVDSQESIILGLLLTILKNNQGE